MKLVNYLFASSVVALGASGPVGAYLGKIQAPLIRANAEAALVQRATKHCSALPQDLRHVCRDAFIRGVESGR